VTSKLQVTLPKALADQYGIAPGDQIEWVASGEAIKVRPLRNAPPMSNSQSRLRLFDRATMRQNQRQKDRKLTRSPALRGWKRQDLYQDGRRSR